MEKGGEFNLETERSRLNESLNLQLNKKIGLSGDYNNTHVGFFLKFEILEDRHYISFNSDIEKIIEKLKKFPYYEEWELFTVKAKDKLTNTDKYILFEEPSVKKLIQEINRTVDELRAIGEEILIDKELGLEKFLSYYKNVILEKARRIMAIISGENITDGTADRISEIL